MSAKDLLQKVRSKFQQFKWKPGAGRYQPDVRPVEEKRSIGGLTEVRTFAVDQEKLDRLLDSIERDQKQREDLLSQLATIPHAADDVIRATQSQTDKMIAVIRPQSALADNLQQFLNKLSERDEEMIGTFQTMADTSAQQAIVLKDVHSALIADADARQKTAEAVGRLMDVAATTAENSAANTDLIDQVRRKVADTDQAMTAAVMEQGRRLTWMLLTVIALLVILAAAVIVKGF